MRVIDENTFFTEVYNVITQGGIFRVYDDKISKIEDVDSYRLQIPIFALDGVCEEVEDVYLAMHGESETTEYKFSLTIKQDFLPLFMQGFYEEMCKNSSLIQLVINQKLPESVDESETLIKWYRHLEAMLFGTEMDTEINKEIFEELAGPSIKKNFLLGKMLIFSCDSQKEKDYFVDVFKQMIARGDQWTQPYNSGISRDDEMMGMALDSN